MKKIFIVLFLLVQGTAFPQGGKTPLDQPPAWAKTAIWYQILSRDSITGINE
jgi:hypothetical protein